MLAPPFHETIKVPRFDFSHSILAVGGHKVNEHSRPTFDGNDLGWTQTAAAFANLDLVAGLLLVTVDRAGGYWLVFFMVTVFVVDTKL